MENELLAKAYEEKKVVYYDCYLCITTDDDESTAIGSFDPKDFNSSGEFSKALYEAFDKIEAEIKKIEDNNTYDTIEDQ